MSSLIKPRKERTERYRCPACLREVHVDFELALAASTGNRPITCECGQILDRMADDLDVANVRSRAVVKPLDPQTARAFILRLANMRLEWGLFDEAGRLVDCFPEFFPFSFPHRCLAMEIGDVYGDPSRMVPGEYEMSAFSYLFWFLGTLRSAWNCEDKDVRTWRLIAARKEAFYISGDPDISAETATKVLGSGPPPKDFFQQALLYLQGRIRTARRCANSQCTLGTYFFADKPNQKYCSGVCSDAARRESNKIWWDSNGAEWRAEQKKSARNAKIKVGVNRRKNAAS
jgi:hypothetical protein